MYILGDLQDPGDNESMFIQKSLAILLKDLYQYYKKIIKSTK